jgi:hypothetical protein
MMANITMLENPMPKKTSKRLSACFVRASAFVRFGNGSGSLPPAVSARRSSRRSMFCQKKRYGEIVVPSTAIKIAT